MPQGPENVWNCIVWYRKTKSEELERKFGNAASVKKALKGYSDKNKYHGHGSEKGATDKQESNSATKALDAAIEFLGCVDGISAMRF